MHPRNAQLAAMSALEARDEIARGSITAAELTAACLEQIAAREPEVQAWAYIDPDHAMRQAAELDRKRSTGRPIGPLHGVPVGVKDIIDTRDMPTENGTTLDAGRRPAADATAVSKLREAGAVILGKTVTTELAVYTPGKTRNPHDAKRTPGGSSSGSAAAVAAGMIPLALGSQTNGSVIRPASFCGVVGCKPSRGLVSRHGALAQSPALDTIGAFARTIEDAALLTDVIAGYDDRDPGSLIAGRPDLLALTRSAPPLKPVLAFVRSSVWDRAGEDVRAGFEEIWQALGNAVQEIELPDIFARVHDWHRTVNMAELARNYARYFDKDSSALSDRLRGLYEEGLTVRAVDYIGALDAMAMLNGGLERIFVRFDAILTPAAPGEAPLGLESTGDPVFNSIWTFCGVPALSLPLLAGSNGMPIGIQLVGRHLYDGRLLRTARWLQDTILNSDAESKSAARGASA
ncbi:MAG: amidase [Pseudomonadota bacterium]|nr:amidase [Pseudomonadota bacterium]